MKMTTERRSANLMIRMTPTEKLQIVERAKALGMKLSEYIRFVLVSHHGR